MLDEGYLDIPIYKIEKYNETKKFIGSPLHDEGQLSL